ncbi:MAG: hypothetical protein CMQ83_05190 [Gammaproteobacteria bacterium]|nr:hypothetical protein [Gammaproteobacteria bacterium]
MTKKLKSASSAKIGKNFTKKRLEYGNSIDEISKKLFINKDYLIAIEEGDYTIFPSKAFAKAYFKKYDDYLGINSDFPNIFEQDIHKRNKKLSPEFKLNKSFKFNLSYLFIFILAGATFLYFLSNKPIAVEGIPEDEIINPIDIDLVVSSIKENNLIKPNNDITIQNNMLMLDFNSECWIELYIDENLVEAQIFNKGDKFMKEIATPFKIIIGNADSVIGTYNNERIDFITNANRLNRVNTIYFLNEQLD